MWINSALINSIRLLLEEDFSLLMAHSVDGESKFTISVRDFIARCERVSQFQIWELYVQTYMSSGGRSFFSYAHLDFGWYRARLVVVVFTIHHVDTNFGPSNPHMWAYGHTGVGDITSAGPSFQSGSRRPWDSSSFR